MPVSRRRFDAALKRRSSTDVLTMVLAFPFIFKPVLIPAARLTLQRICELQEQAAISHDFIAGFQSTCNFSLAVQAFSQRY